MARFGIEEEFVLLDQESLVPLAMSAQTRGRISDDLSAGTVTSEYLTCQLETATEPLATSTEASAQLRQTRMLLGRHADAIGAIAASTGTPFIAPNEFIVSSSPHYDKVSAHLGEITHEHEVNGLHVHVEISDPEERVRALNRARPWLPVLLGLTTNAPFSHGRVSGYASWRSIVIRRLPTSWTPPRFRDHDDYRARIDGLVGMNAISEASSLAWIIRLSERYPTVEVRAFDAQLSVDDTLLATALCRALLLSDSLEDASGIALDAIDDSLWTAARHGLDARIVDPTTGEVAPLQEVADRMLERLRPTLAKHRDEEFVDEMLARLRTDGTGAQRQLRAYEQGGSDALRDLYRRSTTEP